MKNRPKIPQLFIEVLQLCEAIKATHPKLNPRTLRRLRRTVKRELATPGKYPSPPPS